MLQVLFEHALDSHFLSRDAWRSVLSAKMQGSPISLEPFVCAGRALNAAASLRSPFVSQV